MGNKSSIGIEEITKEAASTCRDSKSSSIDHNEIINQLVLSKPGPRKNSCEEDRCDSKTRSESSGNFIVPFPTISGRRRSTDLRSPVNSGRQRHCSYDIFGSPANSFRRRSLHPIEEYKESTIDPQQEVRVVESFHCLQTMTTPWHGFRKPANISTHIPFSDENLNTDMNVVVRSDVTGTNMVRIASKDILTIDTCSLDTSSSMDTSTSPMTSSHTTTTSSPTPR